MMPQYSDELERCMQGIVRAVGPVGEEGKRNSFKLLERPRMALFLVDLLVESLDLLEIEESCEWKLRMLETWSKQQRGFRRCAA